MTSINSLVRNRLKFLDGHVDTVGEDGEKRIFPPGKEIHTKRITKQRKKLKFQIKKYQSMSKDLVFGASCFVFKKCHPSSN